MPPREGEENFSSSEGGGGISEEGKKKAYSYFISVREEGTERFHYFSSCK